MYYSFLFIRRGLWHIFDFGTVTLIRTILDSCIAFEESRTLPCFN